MVVCGEVIAMDRQECQLQSRRMERRLVPENACSTRRVLAKTIEPMGDVPPTASSLPLQPLPTLLSLPFLQLRQLL